MKKIPDRIIAFSRVVVLIRDTPSMECRRVLKGCIAHGCRFLIIPKPRGLLIAHGQQPAQVRQCGGIGVHVNVVEGEEGCCKLPPIHLFLWLDVHIHVWWCF